MRIGPRTGIAVGLLLGICAANAVGHAGDLPANPPPSPEKAQFEDTAVATLNPKVDAVAVPAPDPSVAPPATVPAAVPEVAPAVPAVPSATPAQSGAGDAGDTSSDGAADRKSRFAALKARLHERMGTEADPPAEEPPLPPPPGPMWGLRQPQCLENMGISLSGWLEQGITFNGNHSADGFNGPVDMNDLDSEYQLNQFWITLERPINTSQGFDIGGRVDISYGTDWRWNINNGLENRFNGPDDQTYGLMLPQAYVEAGYNEVSVKLGHFQAPMEYETLASTSNFFYSHSYGYTYGVPHQVTGLLADYRVDGNWSVQGGFHRGWSQFEDDNHTMDVLGGFSWRSTDRKTMISYSASNGAQDVNSAENRFVYSLVIQEQLGPRSQYILVHDLGVENNAMPGGGAADWYGLNQYYMYSINNSLSACVRGEWFRDQDGMAVEGPGTVPGVRAWAGHGFAGNFYELTAGFNWRPQANVVFRPEVRYDWYDGGAGNYSPTNQPGLPFNDGRSSTQFLTAADLILVF